MRTLTINKSEQLGSILTQVFLITAAVVFFTSTTFANSKSFKFTNETGQLAKDLHIEFSRSVTYKSQDPANSFENNSGDGTSRLNFGQGDGTGVPNNGTIKIKVNWGSGTPPKIKKAWWTNSGDETDTDGSDRIGNYLNYDKATGAWAFMPATGDGKYLVHSDGVPHLFETIAGEDGIATANRFAAFIDSLETGMVLDLNNNEVNFTILEFGNINNIDIQVLQMDLTQPFLLDIYPAAMPPEFTFDQAIKQTQFTLNWEGNPMADHYLIQGWMVGVADTIDIMVPASAGSSFPVSGLAKNKTYRWRVATSYDPAGENRSAFSFLNALRTFCVAPDEVASVVTGSGNAQLSWTEVEGSIGYEIFGKQQGTSPVYSIQIPGASNNSYSAAGLTANTTYNYAVKAYCALGSSLVVSDFSPIGSFTTLNATTMKTKDGILETTGSDLIAMYPNPAHHKVEIRGFSGPDKSVRVQVYDLSGKIIYDNEVEGQEAVSISTISWSDGMYNVIVKGEATRSVHKLVIAH